jgi:hypothetical protein
LGKLAIHDTTQARDRQWCPAGERKLENMAKTEKQAQDHLSRNPQLVSLPLQLLPVTYTRLKDSDVTWLYGPLHTAQVEPVRPMKVSSTDDKYGLDPGYKKPILKHRTLSEMLTIHQPSSPILEATKQEEDDDDNNSGRPPLVQTKSDTNIVRVRTGGLRHFAPDSEAPPIGTGDADGKHSPIHEVPTSGKKHISFNTFVEQVIAVDEPQDQQMSDSSDDDMLEMRSSSSRSSRSSRPSFSRNSSSGSGNGEHLTIAKIAPTMLKTNGIYHSNLPAMVYAPPLEYRSPQAEQTTFDFPSPQAQKTKQPWSGDDDDEDDFSSVGYDYYDGQKEDGPSHVVRSGNTPAPVKAQSPKAQSPKTTPQAATLRPPGQTSGDATPSSISSSASSSNTISTSPNVPGRSILKVRPPPHAPKDDTPPSPPLNTYFNYNPSAATGIGGMRSAGAYDIPNASGSPTSPSIPTAAGGEERGRSTSRDRSSLYGRSPSGSSSINSQSSMSPGAPRSPNELPSATKQKPAQAPSLGVVSEAVASPMELDADEYIPARSETPTPHSSPQVSH